MEDRKNVRNQGDGGQGNKPGQRGGEKRGPGGGEQSGRKGQGELVHGSPNSRNRDDKTSAGSLRGTSDVDTDDYESFSKRWWRADTQ